MSLRRRLVFGFALVAIALVVGGFVLARTMRAALIDRVDDQLRTAQPAFGPDRGARLSEFVFVEYDRDGDVVERFGGDLYDETPAYPDPGSMWALAQHLDAGFASYVIATVPCENGSDCHFRVKASLTREGTMLVIGKSLDDVDRTFDQIVLAEVLTATAVLAALAVVAYWVLRQGVRPLDEIATTADAISAGDLSRRVSRPAPHTEAGRVGIAFNRMLSQIEDDIRQREESEQRLKRFVADASHELRTPLTSVRGYAELWRQGGLQDDAALDDAMTRIERESARMGRLVEDLLLLARLDEGIPLQRVPVDLSQIAFDLVADARVVDPDRRITVDAPESVVVIGDDDRLRQAVGNLVTNARTHTPPGTPVHVHVRAEGGSAVLMVRDEGPGMDAETAARVFERFYRADVSRSRTQGGSGLGLSIVAAVVSSLGGTVAVDTAPGRGATFAIRLPLARRDARPPVPAPVA
jgi:two-component system OmpR family sensor kinase